MSAVSEHKANPEDSPSKEHLYVWLDILGFSEEVIQEIERGNVLPEILENFQTNFIGDIRKEIGLEDGRMISDGIILDLGSVSLIADKLEKIFGEIGKQQLGFMTEQERLIRGGIAVGKTLKSVEKGHYISSGLVEAYKLESQQIHWPIIGTTMKEIKKIREIEERSKSIPNGDSNRNFFGLRKTFNKNGEEIYFIDFLSSVEDKEDFKLKLEKITNKNCQTEKGETKSNVINKHTWLYRYYNSKFHPEHISHKLFEGVFL